MKGNGSLKRKSADITEKIFKYFFLISVGYIIIFQLIFMITYAFRPSSEISDPSVIWISKSLTLQHFKDAFETMDYARTFLLTVSIQVASGLFEVLTCSFAAYAFARFKYFGKNLFFALAMLTIVVPTQMLAVPMYLNYARFDIFGLFGLIDKITGVYLKPNLLDTGLVFYLPAIFGAGYKSGLFIFIYRQFFKNLPKELEEAAAIDGAGSLMTFFKIVIPSSGVVFLTVTIFSVVWHWNEYSYSILLFDNNYPLAAKLSMLKTSAAFGIISDRGFLMAGCLLFIVPVLLMYILLQKKFVKSIDRVGIVG